MIATVRPPRCKVLVVGQAGCGKTSIFAHGRKNRASGNVGEEHMGGFGGFGGPEAESGSSVSSLLTQSLGGQALPLLQAAFGSDGGRSSLSAPHAHTQTHTHTAPLAAAATAARQTRAANASQTHPADKQNGSHNSSSSSRREEKEREEEKMRECNRAAFDYGAHISVDFSVADVDSEREPLQLQIWDSHGPPSAALQYLGEVFFRRLHVFVLVYDMSKEDGFESVMQIHKQLEQHQARWALIPVQYVVVANRHDVVLAQRQERLAREQEEAEAARRVSDLPHSPVPTVFSRFTASSAAASKAFASPGFVDSHAGRERDGGVQGQADDPDDVRLEQALNWSMKRNIPLVVTSAATGEGIQSVWEVLGEVAAGMVDGRRGRASSLVAFSTDKSTFSIEADLGLTNQAQSGLDNLNRAGLSKQQLQGRHMVHGRGPVKAMAGRINKAKAKEALSYGSQNEDKSRWVDDADVKACFSCPKAFSFFTRKHHCRRCGFVFCSGCSDNKIPLPVLGYDDPCRVCTSCFRQELNAAALIH